MQLNGFFGRLYGIADLVTRFFYATALWGLFTLAGLVVFGFMPATVALFSVNRKWLMGRDDYSVTKAFIQTFKSEFVKSNLLGLLLLVIGVLVYFDLRFCAVHSAIMMMRWFTLLVAAAYCMMLLYVFPVYVHYDVSVVKCLKYSILLALIHPFRSIAVLLPLVLVVIAVRGVLPLCCISIISYALMRSAYKVFVKIEEKSPVLAEAETKANSVPSGSVQSATFEVSK